MPLAHLAMPVQCPRYYATTPSDPLSPAASSQPLRQEVTQRIGPQIVCPSAMVHDASLTDGRTVLWASSFFVGPCSHHQGRVDLFRHDDGCHRRLLFGAEWLWSPISDRRVGYMSMPGRCRAPKIGPGASVCKVVGKAACTPVCEAASKAMMSRARDVTKGIDGPGAGLALCGRSRLPGLRLLRGPIPMTASPLIFMGGP